jgi:PAS domain S-box-containing protein
MFVWWGPDLIQFYNDGYRPSLRADKHPSAVGQRGMECWPEIWPIIGPQVAAVVGEGESTWNTNQLVPINRNGKLEEIYWTYSYSPVRDNAGTVQGTLVVCSETTEPVLSERRLRTLLAITMDSAAQDRLPESEPLLSLAQSIVRMLDDDCADIPFAALYLVREGKIVHSAGTISAGALLDPGHWPLASVVSSQVPTFVEDLHQRLGDIVCQPWPELVTRAYALPLHLPASPVQAVLVFGISSRLPFDKSYQTFFQLVGTRIAGLLQNEVHRTELAQAAKRFSSLVEANPFGMVIGSLAGDLRYVNPAFLGTLGYSQAEVSAGQVRWDHLTPPEYSAADAGAVEQLRATGRCDVYEKVYLAKDGRRVPILLGASTIGPSAGELEIAAFVTDLTPLKIAQEAPRKANDELEKKVAERTAALEAEVSERKRAEVSLRELTGRLLRTQDEERRHMARELHDHAGQALAGLGMHLSALRNLARNQDPRIIALVAESQEISDALSKEIRTLSYLLHPPLLDEIGLESALRWYVDGFSERSQIKVEMELPADPARLPRELELVIFRIVQESLTNIHRHSGSAFAKIYLARSENGVEFEISDRGKGISPERQKEIIAAKAGVGVRGMEERVHQFGGTLRMTSSLEGTTVRVSLPVTSDGD